MLNGMIRSTKEINHEKLKFDKALELEDIGTVIDYLLCIAQVNLYHLFSFCNTTLEKAVTSQKVAMIPFINNTDQVLRPGKCRGKISSDLFFFIYFGSFLCAFVFVFVALRSSCCFPLIVDVFPSVLVCYPDLFSFKRFRTFEHRYTLVVYIYQSAEINDEVILRYFFLI